MTPPLRLYSSHPQNVSSFHYDHLPLQIAWSRRRNSARCSTPPPWPTRPTRCRARAPRRAVESRASSISPVPFVADWLQDTITRSVLLFFKEDRGSRYHRVMAARHSSEGRCSPERPTGVLEGTGSAWCCGLPPTIISVGFRLIRRHLLHIFQIRNYSIPEGGGGHHLPSRSAAPKHKTQRFYCSPSQLIAYNFLLLG